MGLLIAVEYIHDDWWVTIMFTLGVLCLSVSNFYTIKFYACLVEKQTMKIRKPRVRYNNMWVLCCNYILLRYMRTSWNYRARYPSDIFRRKVTPTFAVFIDQMKTHAVYIFGPRYTLCCGFCGHNPTTATTHSYAV